MPSSPRDQKRDQKVEELRREQQRIDRLFAIFVENPQGAEVLAHLKEHLTGDPFVPGDPYATHVNIGKQYVLNYIIERAENA